jgi:hypothetical protein
VRIPAARIVPSILLISPSRAKSQHRPLAAIMIGTSMRMSWAWTVSGATSAAMPRMNRTLKMLLPTTLPSARSA